MTYKYIDLNKNFYTFKNDIVVYEDETAIIETVKNIANTYKTEIPFNYNGSNIKDLYLKNMNYFDKSDIIINLKKTLEDSINIIEGAEVKNVVMKDNNITANINYFNKELKVNI